jgi:iron complex transport system ATP-binding protein
MTPLIEADELRVGYRLRRGTTVALSDVSFALRRGEMAALVGSNGAGKSTLLRSITGMQPILGGAVRLGGIALDEMPRRERAKHIAVVLSDRLDPPGLRVEEVVALGRHPHHGWRVDQNDHDDGVVSSAIASAGVEHLIGRRCAELSDGERQRVAIARALAQEPEVLVLDEPTAFLDPKGKARIMSLIRRLTAGGTFAAIIASHDLDLVVPHAHQIWVAGQRTLTVGPLSDPDVRSQLAVELGATVVGSDADRRVVISSDD